MNEASNAGNYNGRKLLYVHGRHFKPSADELMDISVAAMRAAIERDYPGAVDLFQGMHTQIAYYADLANEVLTAAGDSYDEALDVGDRRNALQSLCAIDKRKNFGVSRYDRLPGKTAVAEFAAGFVAPVLGSLGLLDKVISKLAPDFGAYLKNENDFASRVRDRVRTAICEAMDDDSQLILVSHGTGCIVTYDALWQLSNDPKYKDLLAGRKIDLWLTLGAPLADNTVVRKLLGADLHGTVRYPSNIVSWHNVSAEDDYMSHDNTVADDFKQMLKQKQISIIKDYRIYNLAVRYGKSNPHSSVGYLIHPRVAQIIVSWLQQDHAAPAS